MKNYRNWLLGGALVALALVSYQPAWNGRAVLDDWDHMITTKAMQSLSGLSELWFQPHTTRQYHPIVDTVYWIESNLWGWYPLGYHLVNILLHVASALLLVRVLSKLEIPGAWFAGAIFALHPVHVESVAWMVELKNTLSGFFFFACILAYLRFDERRNWQSYVLVVVWFVLGVLSKAIVATFPVVVLILFWWKRRTLTWRRDVRPLLPFIALGALSGALTAWMERALSGAVGTEFQLTALERTLIAGRAFWFYLAKLLWPTNLTMFYPRWQVDAQVWWQYLFPIAAVALFVVAWIFRNKNRWLLAALFFFGGLILPLIGFFNVNFFRFSFVADHFQYLPSLGVIVPLAAGWSMAMARSRDWQRAGFGVFAGVIITALAILTWMQCRMYRDVETFYRTIIARNPGSPDAYADVGNELLKHVRLDEANVEFRKTIEIGAGKPISLRRGYVGLGEVSLRRGKVDEAIGYLQTGLAADTHSADGHDALGRAFHQKGQFRDAIVEYEHALRLAPRSVAIQTNLAWMRATCADEGLRNGQEALELATTADRLSGRARARILRTLAAAYAETGQFSKAAETGRRALELLRHEGENPFISVMEHEIALYDAGLPYHESAR